MKQYSRLQDLPKGRADESITEGTLVLEGGAWKGVYTVGVLDTLMLHNINFRTTVGISAGAMCGVTYLTGQIGYSAYLDLTLRHDPRYVGLSALKRDHGITGFSYLYRDIPKEMPLDKTRLNASPRRLVVGATNMLTGKTEYFEKGKCNLSKAVRASATVPFLSKPVMIDGTPYIDGGCSVKIPYPWAKEQDEKKIIVVKTRELSYRRNEKPNKIARLFYKDFPNFIEAMENTNRDFNLMTEELIKEEAKGNIFLVAPSEKVAVTRFESDMEKLGELYWLGRHDMEERIGELRSYLER
ncbi:MAG: patatin family protein [Lachnospiraceae bacterium]|nr:patatin family protein [Lachnospiraceae bacterium]